MLLPVKRSTTNSGGIESLIILQLLGIGMIIASVICVGCEWHD
jgi:hypothetical protein